MFEYELNMINGDKFKCIDICNKKDFKEIITMFSKDDLFIETKEGVSVRCKYIVSIK